MKITLLVLTTLTTASADTLWLRRYDGSLDDFATGVACDSRQAVVGGHQMDSVDYDYDWLVLWYGQDGTLLRSEVYEMGAEDEVTDADLALDGRAILGGYSYTFDGGAGTPPLSVRFDCNGQAELLDLDGVVLKLDTNGVAIWETRIPWVEVNGIAADAQGGCAVSGTWRSVADYDIFCARVGPGGESLWARTLDFGLPDFGWHIACGPAATVTQVATTSEDSVIRCLIVRWSASGETLWTRRSRSPVMPGRCAVTVDDDGNCYVGCGARENSSVEALLMKYSASGELLWERRLAATSRSHWVSAAVVGNGVVVVGETQDSLGFDILIGRYSSDGETLWTARWDAGEDDMVGDVDCDAAGNPVLAGSTLDANDLYDCVTLKYGSGPGLLEHSSQRPARPLPTATVARGVLNLVSDITNRSSDIVLLDATGRRVMQLRAGLNDISALAPGVYFVHAGGAPTGKVALAR